MHLRISHWLSFEVWYCNPTMRERIRSIRKDLQAICLHYYFDREKLDLNFWWDCCWISRETKGDHRWEGWSSCSIYSCCRWSETTRLFTFSWTHRRRISRFDKNTWSSQIICMKIREIRRIKKMRGFYRTSVIGIIGDDNRWILMKIDPRCIDRTRRFDDRLFFMVMKMW